MTALEVHACGTKHDCVPEENAVSFLQPDIVVEPEFAPEKK